METAAHASSPLLPTDQQMLTLVLDGRRLLARIVTCDGAGRLSLVVFDVDLGVREALARLEPLSVEYVKVGLCRAVFTPLRIEDTGGPRAPLVLVQGRIGAVDSVQRRDNYRVRLALPVEILLLNGSAEREGEATWRAGRSVNVSVEGLCVETAHELRRGDVVTVRLHTEVRVLEADARVLGLRPAPESALPHYGMQLIQIPRADQQLLTLIIKQEEQRGLAYRIGR